MVEIVVGRWRGLGNKRGAANVQRKDARCGHNTIDNDWDHLRSDSFEAGTITDGRSCDPRLDSGLMPESDVHRH